MSLLEKPLVAAAATAAVALVSGTATYLVAKPDAPDPLVVIAGPSATPSTSTPTPSATASASPSQSASSTPSPTAVRTSARPTASPTPSASRRPDQAVSAVLTGPARVVAGASASYALRVTWSAQRPTGTTWEWGDGTVTRTACAPAGGREGKGSDTRTAAHRYARAGSYAVKVTVSSLCQPVRGSAVARRTVVVTRATTPTPTQTATKPPTATPTPSPSTG